ncbi:C-type lectin domain family 12 member B-like isoform X2 [Nelusetta ayraudi]|uniref:C-type lectin domain family 12 member B-like isoform X2 n=1 Tax=Nelusetta ayraudi TaxID=303726 RepID=UPI003F7125E0
MEENITYATVVIKDGKQPPRAKTEESTVYASVKAKLAATTSSSGAGAGCSWFRVLMSCSVLLFLILLGSIGLLIHFRLLIGHQQTQISHLEAQVEQLRGLTEQLNWTLNVIMSYEKFPVKMFCQGHRCQPCKDDWIEFHNKCYLFYEEEPPWKTWGESRRYCQEKDADLVAIDSLREQEFISSHTKSYYDTSHGYWMGLQQNSEKQWVWLDGRKDTLGFWAQEDLGTFGQYGLMIPARNATDSWDPAKADMENKLICESVALLKTDDE